MEPEQPPAARGSEREGLDDLAFRDARREDLPLLVAMLAHDPLGSRREDPGPPLPESYSRAFEAIAADPHQELLVATRNDEVVGMLQLTRIPSLTYRGGWRALLEGVRVREDQRGRGVGRALVLEAVERARASGCRLLQLTTDRSRPEALRFYEGLGMIASHHGLKLDLQGPS